VTDLPLDAHLMIVELEQHVLDFIKAGADIVSAHCEQSSTIHLYRTVNQGGLFCLSDDLVEVNSSRDL